MLSLLSANCVTGAASLFPRDLLDDALPLPPAQFMHYHDHWLALTALALGDIRYVARPLYDYVQHEHATLGHATATRMVRLRDRLSSLRRGLPERVRLLANALLRRRLPAAPARDRPRAALRRPDEPAQAPRARSPRARRPLRAARSPPCSRAARASCCGGGPRRSAPSGCSPTRSPGGGCSAATARDSPQQAARLDALPPHALQPRPRVHVPGDPDLRVLAEQILPLRLAPADGAPERINLLVGGIDPRQPFEGVPARLHLARRLAERGERVRIVTVDPVGGAPARLGARRRGARRRPGALRRGRARARSASRPGSRSAGTTRSSRRTGGPRTCARAAADRFLYLIGDYEPLRHPAGTFAALAAESYTFPHVALFSSEPLREYFRRHGAGVYADGSQRATAARRCSRRP